MSTDKFAIEPPVELLEKAVPIVANGLAVLERRYLRRGLDGQPVENVQQMFWRVASWVASHSLGASDKSALAAHYYQLLTSIKFFPNSPTFTGAGTALGQLAACFVLAIDDDMGKDSNEGIFSTLRAAALIQQTGGGIGFSFSRLRPKGDVVASSRGVASGPISFLKVYDTAFGAIAQGGTRRGANMAVLRVDHPDIEEFISCKGVEGQLTNFNISVGITDSFMQAVKSAGKVDLVNPRDGKVVRQANALEIFDTIARYAWRNGEPGVLFLDAANRSNPVPHLYTLEATNPCGEQYLGPYENCCLGSINLSQFITSTCPRAIDWTALRAAVRTATRFLDDVIASNKFVPVVPQLREAAERVRRIGVGIMGLADLFYSLRVRYGSPQSLDLASQVVEFVRYETMLQSIELAKERGAFPGIKGSVYDPENITWVPPTPLRPYEREWGRPEIDWTRVVAGIKAHGIRNGAQTTVAPTGTIATVAGCEGYGCEPVFALAYTRHVKEGSTGGNAVDLRYVSPAFTAALDEAGVAGPVREAILERVCEVGTCQDVEQLPAELRHTFVVSADITAREHVVLQAALQRFIDNSISKTVNFPAGATVEEVKEAYLMAWELGCKGLTIYVTGSRDVVVLETKATADSKKAAAAAAETSAAPAVEAAAPAPTSAAPAASEYVPEIPSGSQTPRESDEESEEDSAPAAHAPVHPFQTKRPRPDVLIGATYHQQTPLGEAYITVNHTEDKEPFEVFLTVGKGGSDVAAVSEALGRLASLTLRLPSLLSPTERLEQVVAQLEGIGGRAQKRVGRERIISLPDAIAHSLKAHLQRFVPRGNSFFVSPSSAKKGAAQQRADQPPTPQRGKSNVSFNVSPVKPATQVVADLCPECGSATLMYEEGCRKCHACGFSEC